MIKEHEIVSQVALAQREPNAADQLLRQYMPFIRKEASAFLGRILNEAQDDELSIAMFGFYQAICTYERQRGSFLAFASRVIRNQLIDFNRKERRHQGQLSLDESDDEDEDDRTRYEKLELGVQPIEDKVLRDATREEIEDFQLTLKRYDLTLTDVADSCPKQERTLQQCHQALQYAKEHTELLDALVRTKKLPMAQLALGAGISKKTLERHRKYIVAIMLAYTNGFELIRGHLKQVSARNKGG